MALTKDEIYERSRARAKGSESQKRLTASHRERVRTKGYQERTRTSPSVVASQLRIDRQSADQEFRKSQSIASQQARIDAENRRIARQDQQARRSIYNSSVDSVLPDSSGSSSFTGTSTGKAVGGGVGSVGGAIFRVVLVVITLSLLYLFVSNGGQGGSTLLTGLNNILSSFWGNQSLFVSNTPNTTPNSTIGSTSFTLGNKPTPKNGIPGVGLVSPQQNFITGLPGNPGGIGGPPLPASP